MGIKKYIATALLVLLGTTGIALADYNGVASISSTDFNSGSRDYAWDSADGYTTAVPSNTYFDTGDVSVLASSFIEGHTYRFMRGAGGGACNGGSLASCMAAQGAGYVQATVYTGLWYTNVPAPSTPTMDSVISNASTTFSTAVGFSWADVVSFMKSLLLLVIGSGLGLLEVLLPYIIALVTIGAIVYFLYRAFRFFRH